MSLLKWVGGKAWLADKLREAMPEKIDLYVDPFCGGLGAFFAVQDRCKWALLSDANQRLIDFWRAVRDESAFTHTEMEANAAAYTLAKSGDTGRKNLFYNWRNAMNANSTFTLPVAAARFWALNKTCFNGLYRENRREEFNVPWGKRKKLVAPSLEEVRDMSDRLQRVGLRCGDGLKALSGVLLELDLATTFHMDPGIVVYLDPPYLDTFSSYTSGGFNLSHHEELARLFHKLPEGQRLASNSIEARHFYPNHEVVMRPCRVRGGLTYKEEILAW